MRKRFLVKQNPLFVKWELYWCDETGTPEPEACAAIYDKATLDLLVQAPALAQMRDVKKQFDKNPAMLLRKREYKSNIFGRFQVAMGHFLKKL